jgi:hypothetical protein
MSTFSFGDEVRQAYDTGRVLETAGLGNLRAVHGFRLKRSKTALRHLRQFPFSSSNFNERSPPEAAADSHVARGHGLGQSRSNLDGLDVVYRRHAVAEGRDQVEELFAPACQGHDALLEERVAIAAQVDAVGDDVRVDRLVLREQLVEGRAAVAFHIVPVTAGADLTIREDDDVVDHDFLTDQFLHHVEDTTLGARATFCGVEVDVLEVFKHAVVAVQHRRHQAVTEKADHRILCPHPVQDRKQVGDVCRGALAHCRDG